MNKLILFVKTYKKDFDRCRNLLLSILKFNKNNIPVVVSVNDEDYEYFVFRLHESIFKEVQFIRDSSIIETTIKDGWQYQQIIKSNVYRLGVCKNYLCLDSDAEFIRDFSYDDFLYDEDTPYTIMHEGKELLESFERIGIDTDKVFFKEVLRYIRPLFGNRGKYWDYGPSPYIWSCRVWQHFNEVYLADRNMTFDDFFHDLSKHTWPSEAIIYGEYLLKTRLIEIHPIQGYFKVYHYKKQYEFEKKNMTKEKLAKIYLGIIFQSNWKMTKWYNFLK